jgi:hypothetical protein
MALTVPTPEAFRSPRWRHRRSALKLDSARQRSEFDRDLTCTIRGNVSRVSLDHMTATATSLEHQSTLRSTFRYAHNPLEAVIGVRKHVRLHAQVRHFDRENAHGSSLNIDIP